jgi:hypothetical protein
VTSRFFGGTGPTGARLQESDSGPASATRTGAGDQRADIAASVPRPERDWAVTPCYSARHPRASSSSLICINKAGCEIAQVAAARPKWLVTCRRIEIAKLPERIGVIRISYRAISKVIFT